METPSSRTPVIAAPELQRRHIVAKAIVVGVVTGIVGAAFRLALDFAERHRDAVVRQHRGWEGLLVSSLAGALAGGCGVWLVRRFAPHARGSGIPQVKAVLLGEAPLEWKRMLPVKFLGGLLAIGGGFALGREGPTIQMGAGLGGMLSERFRVRRGEGERRALISAGAGAGLAAAFNAPLSGLVFVLEELHGNFSPILFVAAFLASVSSDIMARLLSGAVPVFHLTGVVAPTTAALPWAALLGVAIGVLGVAFNRCILVAVTWRVRRPTWSAFGVGAGVGLLVGSLGWAVPGMVGSGAMFVQRAFIGDVAVSALPLFLLARFALTVIGYGSGASGGIFAPLLVLGALAGLWFGAGVHALVALSSLSPTVFCVLGMGAMFTAVVRAPLTGIVLMIELTGVYDFMLPLLVSCLAAYGVAEGLGNKPIYEALREISAASPEPAAR
ncbi:MAG TPA: H(+)/Cl(-) exchange transporter ClcA [Opitutaceae bacterium]|nr:H(+)/Cl(-) exchange transporter ClcA [Opitutaceae bacterium]